jgi:phage gpG-like protein
MIDAEVKGLIELQRKAEQMIRDTHGAPILQAMQDSTLQLERMAKQGLVGYVSPHVGGVDTGRLRASITPSVSTEGADVIGVVGSNLSYAPAVEYGTQPHSVAPEMVETWAQRHGVDVMVVVNAIRRRGTFGKHFMEGAFKLSVDWIKQRFERAVQEIVNK